MKRLFDILFSAIMLVLLSPVFLLLAILIKIFSPKGPIFFAHKRLGKDKIPFKLYKFRTMVPDAQAVLEELFEQNPEIKAQYEQDFKLKHDPRVIPVIGNFLRKTSLDELPQFINSLIGDISVVGPRPIVEWEVEKYGIYADKFFSIKPGITGLWQISGRNDTSYENRVKLDMQYIDKRSFLGDLAIVIKTPFAMISRKGAY